MENNMTLFIFFLLITALILISRLHSLIEKSFLTNESNIIAFSFDTWSLGVFKKVKLILLCVGSFESAWFGLFKMELLIGGFSIFIIGSILRCLAVHTLGRYWNYNVILYKNHKIVRKGIYRFIRHPGYIGNVYLVGIFISLGSIITTILSILFILLFYLYRTKIENKIFYSRRSKYGKLGILPWHFKPSI